MEIELQSTLSLQALSAEQEPKTQTTEFKSTLISFPVNLPFNSSDGAIL